MSSSLTSSSIGKIGNFFADSNEGKAGVADSDDGGEVNAGVADSDDGGQMASSSHILSGSSGESPFGRGAFLSTTNDKEMSNSDDRTNFLSKTEDQTPNNSQHDKQEDPDSSSSKEKKNSHHHRKPASSTTSSNSSHSSHTHSTQESTLPLRTPFGPNAIEKLLIVNYFPNGHNDRSDHPTDFDSLRAFGCTWQLFIQDPCVEKKRKHLGVTLACVEARHSHTFRKTVHFAISFAEGDKGELLTEIFEKIHTYNKKEYGYGKHKEEFKIACDRNVRDFKVVFHLKIEEYEALE